MQELRLVAVSEDGHYAILDVPGRSGRFSLLINDRLRAVARGQFSRLAQYEIEVESSLRPKEIQDRIRAGEKAADIADAAGVPIEQVRRFEGPVLAEREFRAREARQVTIRSHGDCGPGPRLGDIVAERLAEIGPGADELAWDSHKRADGNWQIRLEFCASGQPRLAEWVFDPRRRHVTPIGDVAARLCLPPSEWPVPSASPEPSAPAALAEAGRGPGTATVTPIADRLLQAHQPGEPGSHERTARPAPPAPPVPSASPARRAAGGRSRRASVPSWDEIMLGNSRQPD